MKIVVRIVCCVLAVAVMVLFAVAPSGAPSLTVSEARAETIGQPKPQPLNCGTEGSLCGKSDPNGDGCCSLRVCVCSGSNGTNCRCEKAK